MIWLHNFHLLYFSGVCVCVYALLVFCLFLRYFRLFWWRVSKKRNSKPQVWHLRSRNRCGRHNLHGLIWLASVRFVHTYTNTSHAHSQDLYTINLQCALKTFLVTHSIYKFHNIFPQSKHFPLLRNIILNARAVYIHLLLMLSFSVKSLSAGGIFN